MTDFYFVSLKHVGSATILDGKAKSRFICFKDNKILILNTCNTLIIQIINDFLFFIELILIQ